MIPDSFIQSILARIDSPEVIGVGIVGSYARGGQARYSDVDIDVFVSKLPESEYDRYTLRYWDEKLVSLKYTLLDDEQAALTNPERAIWAVPGLQQMRIVLDKDGSLHGLQQSAVAFDWNTLQSAANEYAAEQVMGCSEEAHKILNGLAHRHESAVLYAIWGLVNGMLRAVAVQRGLLIISENRYLDMIQDAIGRDTEWTRAFRTAWGLETVPSDVPQFQARGAAALALYCYTAAMFEGLIPDKHRDVVKANLKLIQEAGY